MGIRDSNKLLIISCKTLSKLIDSIAYPMNPIPDILAY